MLQPIDNEFINIVKKMRKIFSEQDSELQDYAHKKLNEWLSITTEVQIKNYISELEKTFPRGKDEQVQEKNDFLLQFFCYVTDLCIEHTLQTCNFSSQGDSLLYPSVPYTMDYSYIDQLSKLIVILLCTASANIRKNELLDKICESILLVLCKYHEEQYMFNQRPFFKLLINIIFDITRPQYNFEPQEILNMFSTLSELFEQLQPLRFPGFAFAWLELISNRYFMPVLL